MKRPSLYISSTWRPQAVATPLHDELAARPYVPLDDKAVRALAAEWLREMGEKARAALRPRVTSPATDRDYTGSFPVVAVAA